MEPIDYRDALVRRWRLILVLALVGAIVGVLVPLHTPNPVPKTQYQTSSLVGVTPGGAPPTVGQIDFYAATTQVMADAAQAAGLRKASAAGLEKDLTVGAGKKKAGSPNGTVVISIKQPSPKRSAKLTNAFALSLGNYIQTDLNNDYQSKLSAAQSNVCNLQTQVNSVDNQLAALVAPNGPGAQGVSNPLCSSSGSGSDTGSSSASGDAYFVPGTTTGATGAALLSAASSTTDPTTTTPATTTPTTAPSGPSSTGRNNPDVADLQAQSQALTAQYVAATQRAQALSDAGAPQSGYVVLQPAVAAKAKVIPAGLSLLDHHSVRFLLGFLVGALVGAGIALLLAGLDKRLRTVVRASETFGFPVVGEIQQAVDPRPRRLVRRGPPPIPPPTVPVMSDPTSPQAEAYRMLRMAVELAPLAGMAHDGQVTGQSGGNSAAGSSPPAVSSAPMMVAVAERPALGAGMPLWIDESATPAAASAQPGAGHALVAARSGPRRQVVLVLSAGLEPSARLVCANLAATYAEAGQQAQLITTDDLRRGGGLPGGLFQGRDEIGVGDVVAQSIPTGIAGVRSLSLGRLLNGPGQLATRAPSAVAAARQIADVVIVEAAAMLTTHDAEALVPTADVVLVVGECAFTTVDQATQAGDLLRRIGAPVVGVVLTNIPVRTKNLRTANSGPETPTSTRSVGARPPAHPPAGPSKDRKDRKDRKRASAS